MYLSKSIYVRVWNCLKFAWINKHHPELLPINADMLARLRTGNDVGDPVCCRLDTLAMVKVWEELRRAAALQGKQRSSDYDEAASILTHPLQFAPHISLRRSTGNI